MEVTCNSGKTKNINFMGLHKMEVACVQDPFRTDIPINWIPVGNFLVDSVTAGRDDASQFDVMAEELDDSIFTEFTQQPFKLGGNIPNLTEDGKRDLGGYQRSTINGKGITQTSGLTPTVIRMVRLTPKSGKYSAMVLYNTTINLSMGDNLSKTATFNDKMMLTALAPTAEMTYSNGATLHFEDDLATGVNILSFSLAQGVAVSVAAIDVDKGEVTINVGATNSISGDVVDITALVPFVTLSDGAEVTLDAGGDFNLLPHDFTAQVLVNVAAEDGVTVKAWGITVTQA